MDGTEYLSPQDVVARYKGQIKSVGTLANWRIQKQGPPYTKIGGRVLYPLDKLIEWEKSRTRVYGYAIAVISSTGYAIQNLVQNFSTAVEALC